MAVNVGILNAPKLYNYHYDQLNRLTGMDVLNGTNTGLNLWSNNLTATNDYQERVSYDGNGNILTYTRNGYGGTQSMDNLTYHYNAGTNQLNHISDAVSSGNYPNDLDDQSSDNYSYDETGNLTRDQQAGITTDMTWSVYGKLLTIPSRSISYQYDAAGNRIGKTVGSDNTWYVRDAQGNILATYSGSGMALQEQDLYGSSRLGMVDSPAALTSTPQYLDHLGSGTLFTFTRGKKLFELTNHLGNVLATVSDKKFGTAVTGIPSQISYYSPDIKSVQDYYPFGMEMPGRSYNATYRYSFNGKRDDKDAEYGWQDYGMREYDRLGVHFISPDPLAQKYPWYSPYQFAGNKPIVAADLDGMEEWMKTQENLLRQRAIDKIDNLRVNALSKRAYFNSSPDKSQYQEQLQEKYRTQKNQELGYNDDGSKPPLMRLAQNKTWNSFAENIALPSLDVLSFADGVGELRSLYRGAESFLGKKEFEALARTGTIDPKSIRFSQDDISATFRNGKDVQDLIDQLKGGQKINIEPIRIVQKDGMVYTLDNRRLYTYQQAGVEIPYIKLDEIPKNELKKFSTLNQGTSIKVRTPKKTN
jgi:RHS repeat-associated protein